MQQLKSVFGLLIIAAALFCGWHILPAYISNYQLETAIDEAARSGEVVRETTDEGLRTRVLQEAQALKIDLSPEQIQVQRLAGEVQIWAEYSVHIDLKVYAFDLTFQPMSKSRKRALS